MAGGLEWHCRLSLHPTDCSASSSSLPISLAAVGAKVALRAPIAGFAFLSYPLLDPAPPPPKQKAGAAPPVDSSALCLVVGWNGGCFASRLAGHTQKLLGLANTLHCLSMPPCSRSTGQAE